MKILSRSLINGLIVTEGDEKAKMKGECGSAQVENKRADSLLDYPLPKRLKI